MTNAAGRVWDSKISRRGGKEKQWTDCVQSDIQAFGILGDSKSTVLKAEVWVETAVQGGRRFIAAWRKEEVDAARHRQEKGEATKLGTLLSHPEGSSVEICEATPFYLVDESKESLYGREADRDLRSACRCVTCFHFIFSERAAWGLGERALPDFLFCSLFPLQQTTSGIGHCVK